MSKKVLIWIVALPVVLLLLGVAGAFVYTRTDSETERLTVDDAPTTSTDTETTGGGDGDGDGGGDATSAGIEGTYKVSSGSQAGYRVKEILFGQETTAVGRTSDVTGEMTIAGTAVTKGTFTVDMTTVASDKSQRDGQFRNRIMSTSEFPTSTFVLTKPIELGSIPADGEERKVKATGDLTLRGTKKPVTIDLTAKRAGSSITVAGSLPISFPEWKIPNPSGGPAEVGDDGEMELLLVLAR